jgi:hypothetical protein
MQGRDDREVTGELRADWKKGQRHYSLNQHPITRKKPHRSNAGCELRELGARAHGCWDHRLENAFIVKGNQHTTVNGNAWTSPMPEFQARCSIPNTSILVFPTHDKTTVW